MKAFGHFVIGAAFVIGAFALVPHINITRGQVTAVVFLAAAGGASIGLGLAELLRRWLK